MILDSKLLLDKNIKGNVTKANKAIATLYCLLKRYSPIRTKEKNHNCPILHSTDSRLCLPSFQSLCEKASQKTTNCTK